MQKKKKTRRDKAKFPALEPALNLKNRQDQIQDLCEYKDKLNDEEKDYLNKFSEEFICANLKHKGRKLHKTVEHKKSINRMNNNRNQCALSKGISSGCIDYLEDMNEDVTISNNIEDEMIDKIDNPEPEDDI